MKKVLSLFICLLMVLSTLAPAAVTASATTTQDDVVTILAASDFQTKGTSLSAGGSYDVFEASEEGAGIVKKLMSQVTAVHSNIDGFLFGGDYAHGDSIVFNTAIGYTYLSEALSEGGLSEDADKFYIAGNHEKGLLGDENLDFFAPTGGYDMGDYGVYCINHDQYPYKEMNNDLLKTVTETTANDLKAWLDTQQPGEKPIFVMSHLSLHYSTRTRNRNDGLYAQYIVDVLNEAGKRGLNIIFLYGHNHSGGYDTYMGGSTNFATVGDTIWVAKPGMALSTPAQQMLHFTYMNYGYLGYYESTTADNDFTMTVFEVQGDDVVIYRYDQDGQHDVQAREGKYWNDNNYGYQPDTKTAPYGTEVYGGKYTLTLSDHWGVVTRDAKMTTPIGSTITKTWEDGKKITVDATLELLYRGDKQLTEEDLVNAVLFSGLDLKYHGVVLSDKYVLEVLHFDYGDVNYDGYVNAADALLVLQGSVDKVELDDNQWMAADVDGNLNVDAVDALLVLQFAVGKIQKFPVEE
jgi:hypothetical protein